MSVGEKDKKTLTKRKNETPAVLEPSNVKKAKKIEPKKDYKGKKPFAKQFQNKKFPAKGSAGHGKGNAQAPTEKQDWNELKKKKKDLKVQRKKDRFQDEKLYEVDLSARKVYEQLKVKKSDKDKTELCRELHTILKKLDYSKVVMNHSTSRMVQLLLKKGPHDIKQEIGLALVPHIVQIAASKYAQFCINRMLLYCGKDIREQLCEKLMGNIVKLASSNTSSSLIDLIYLKFTSEEHKQFMRQEFYSDLYKNSKDKSVKCLKDTWKDSDVLKKGTLSSLKSNLLKIASKNLADNCLIHAVLMEFLEESTEEERGEIITAYSTHLAAISSTKQGMKAARLCYQHSPAKDRRAMLKSMKEHVVKLCNHEFGHLVMIAVLNFTDDTQMIGKIIISSIVSSVREIADNEFGRRVLLFIVAPNNKFFHPSLLQEFENELKEGTQKKDMEIRRKELFDGYAKLILDSLKNDVSFWLKDGHIARVFAATLHNCSELKLDLTGAFQAIAALICNPNWKITEKPVEEVAPKISIKPKRVRPDEDEEKKKKLSEAAAAVEVNGIEDAGIHMSLKIILALPGAAEALLEAFEDDTIKNWLKINRGCFMLVEIINRNENDETRADLLKRISEHDSELKAYTHAGAGVLKKLIKV